MKEILIVVVLVAAVATWIYLDRLALKRRMSSAFSGRVPLSDHEFHKAYFGNSGIPPEIAIGVRSVLADELQVDLSRISDMDDFSENLRFLLEQDSMIDVAIVESLERRFGIRISNEEAAKMTTIREIVTAVHRKLVTV